MKYLSLILIITLLFACEGESPSGPKSPDPSSFDRQAMLLNWADNIIIPGLTSFAEKTGALKNAGEAFTLEPSQGKLEALRTAWTEAYLLWQKVSMFNVGKAAEIRYRDQLNIYPANVIEIEENISQSTYDLSLSSQNDRQGFPALDYLLQGLGNDDAEILAFYTNHSLATNYKTYLLDLVSRIDDLTNQVLSDWTDGGYRETFISNDGNTATSSVNMLINDYVFYFEKNVRAGKIGIPAGVFSGNPLSTHVEAYYKKDLSKTLFLAALDACQQFFKGKAFASTAEGTSLNDYLDFLMSLKNGADLSNLINAQFEKIKTQASGLDDNFVAQIETDNVALLATYDQLQLNVVLLKVDMLQALNINVDYVDADGD